MYHNWFLLSPIQDITYEIWIKNKLYNLLIFAASCDLTVPTSYKPSGTNTNTWWRHQMETFSASLALCAGTSPVTGESPTQRPVTRSFDVFFDLCLNKRLSKQSQGWCFETPSRSLWRHCNVLSYTLASHEILYVLSLCLYSLLVQKIWNW